jgi:hypothetical protein
MKSQSAAAPKAEREGAPTTQPKSENLDRRYGKIGIPAVAAALRYQSDAKNPAYAPAVPREDKRFLEMTAA